jgi:hypothetical protein
MENKFWLGKYLLRFRLLLLSLFLFSGALAYADSGLLYLEAQGVGGYSSLRDKGIYYSMSQNDVMQKPSIGADWIQKLSGDTGDWGTLALQGRLAYDDQGHPAIEPQLYNAYVRVKTPYAYSWVGHNRVPVGLESYFDTHSLLLQSLPMSGFGFDRDWGAGASRDFNWGDAAFSLTSGTGMPLQLKGSYLFSGRVAKGVLNRDNYTCGLYGTAGKIPDIIGYHTLDSEPKGYGFLGVDLTYVWDRLEWRADIRKGEKEGSSAYAALGRFGINFLDENRLKLEFQPIFTKQSGQDDRSLAGGFSYLLTPDLTCRSLYEYDKNDNDHRIVFQIYYYVKV